ncbi:MAG: DUF2795 domain-containing protein [Actinomycetota bacterium]|nr:DUF2795 domain-containing protein [Actinomycetota bacterium]
MDFNPDDAKQYIEGAEYPATKEDIISAAESNGAPESVVEAIGRLPTPEFASAEDVVADLRAIPGAG